MYKQKNNRRSTSKDALMQVILISLCSICTFSSCRKFLEVDLGKQLVDAKLVFSEESTASSAVTAMYQNLLSSQLLGGVYRMSGSLGLTSDELFQYVPDAVGFQFQNNQLDSRNQQLINLWAPWYKAIYQSNAILEGLRKAEGINTLSKNQLNGEAFFMRGFSYFYLINTFDSVPLLLTTDYQVNSLASKESVDRIYNQIEKDLRDAQNLLPESYMNAERFRPNKFTATALLARIHLYRSDWQSAELQSSLVIENPLYFLAEDPNQVFTKASSETIWQFASPSVRVNTWEASVFVINATPRGGIPVLRNEFVDSFETGDQRREKWIGLYSNNQGSWYFPYKYKVNEEGASISEYLSVLGLAEQILIRAEAKIQQNKIAEGVADLNLLRSKRRNTPSVQDPNPLPDLLLTLSKEEALIAVENERKHELFTEWGHRWFDLKRTMRATAVLAPIKGTYWQDSDVIFPIPQAEIERNPNL